MDSTILARAQAWLAQDPDPETHTELSLLIDQATQGNAQAQKALYSRFNGRLQFGTAGLRGKLQAGSMGMNRVLVAQAAAGLAAYLKQHESEPSIVIGYDGRKNSAVFARDTAEIMAGAGIRTLLLPRLLPTPVLAYAIRYFDTSAGVMVTASHNPPEDNGYKVYLGKQNGGGQIVSPADADIAACIDHVAQHQSINTLARSQDYTVVDDAVVNSYVQETAKLAVAPPTPLNYVYTAMHGVGKEVLLQTLTAANFPHPHLVQEQCEPDGTFPTVAFPNPEEKGALDLAIALAKQHNAELILANDPDADRLAVALPDPEGHWTALHGNTIGCFLAWHLGKRAQHGTLACSLVSSPALAAIAQHCGLRHEETLTGFKYIAQVDDLLFGFEEALGYLPDPNKVRDKDGISAAIAFLDLVNDLKQQGKTVHDYANEFVATFGAYVSGQVSIRVADLAQIDALMSAFRQHPPTQIGEHPVEYAIDHLYTERQSNILVYTLNNGCRLIVRPSGTEPKIKFYLDAKGKNAKDALCVLRDFEHAVRQMLRLEQYGKQDC